ncbi:MAG: ABC transporter substrate-binding protein [Pseudomonadota bacterium]
MKRREFVALLGGALAAPAVLAQQAGRKYRIGMLIPVSAAAIPPYRAALAEQLTKHGFVEGQNLEIEARAASDSSHEDRQTVREMLNAKPDALFTCFTSVTSNALTVTKTTPIVFAWVYDPVAAGIVKSFARPGGNATGVTNRVGELLAKRLELALELVPGAKRVGLIGGGPGATWDVLLADVRKAAAGRGVELIHAPVQGSVEGALSRATDGGAQAAIFLFPYVFAPIGTETGIRFVREKRLPALYMDVAAAENGGLISLGTNFLGDIRRGADLLAKVLRGEKPATIPIDQAARFELVVNLKTARELGLAIPQSILLRADRVIE